MGGIAIEESAPSEPEGSLVLPNDLFSHPLNPLKNPFQLLSGSACATVTTTTTTAATELLLSNNGLTHLGHANDGTNVGAHADSATSHATQPSLDPSGTALTSTPTFSFADYLVPGLHVKVWDDWQGADDFITSTTNETHPLWTDQWAAAAMSSAPTSSTSHHHHRYLAQFGILDGNGVWEAETDEDEDDRFVGVPADMAYDEMVFDLAPSAFETPMTVNVADLIVGPATTNVSVAPPSGSVSPIDLDLELSRGHPHYDDLILANLYGFTEPLELDVSDSESDNKVVQDMDEDDSEDLSDDDLIGASMVRKNTVHSNQARLDGKNTALLTTLVDITSEVDAEESLAPSVQMEDAMTLKTSSAASLNTNVGTSFACNPPLEADPTKRRMEEALATRVLNDLDNEHIDGLIGILKSASANCMQDAIGSDDDDDELVVDFAMLDEKTLVQVYQYLEECSMQSKGSTFSKALTETSPADVASGPVPETRKSVRNSRQRLAQRQSQRQKQPRRSSKAPTPLQNEKGSTTRPRKRRSSRSRTCTPDLVLSNSSRSSSISSASSVSSPSPPPSLYVGTEAQISMNKSERSYSYFSPMESSGQHGGLELFTVDNVQVETVNQDYDGSSRVAHSHPLDIPVSQPQALGVIPCKKQSGAAQGMDEDVEIDIVGF